MSTNISDELLARYMAGQTLAAEDDIVLDFLAESDERLEDFANMCGALERYYQKRQAVSQSRPRVPFYYNKTLFWSVVAAVAAVLIVVGVFWICPAMTDGPLVAENDRADSSTIVPTPPSVVNADLQATPSSHSTSMASSDNLDNEASVQLQRQECVTASQCVAVPVFDVLCPRRSRDASPQGTPVEFKWNSNASKLYLSVTDESGSTIIDAEVTHCQRYTLSPDLIVLSHELHWILRAVFADGTSMQKEGTIAIE